MKSANIQSPSLGQTLETLIEEVQRSKQQGAEYRLETTLKYHRLLIQEILQALKENVIDVYFSSEISEDG